MQHSTTNASATAPLHSQQILTSNAVGVTQLGHMVLQEEMLDCNNRSLLNSSMILANNGNAME
jgi:hypothetical protein